MVPLCAGLCDRLAKWFSTADDDRFFSLDAHGETLLLMITYANTPITARHNESETRKLAVELITQLLDANNASRVAAPKREPMTELDLLFNFGEYTIDPRFRRVFKNGISIPLALREYELLLALAQRAGEPVSKDILREEVWLNRIDSNSRSIDQHIAELRKKLGATGAGSPIATVRKYGYALSGEWIPRLRVERVSQG